MSSVAQPPPSEEYRLNPEMRTTAYDVSRAGLLALLLGFAAATALVAVLYAMLRPSEPLRLVPIEIEDATGGYEDGAVDETADVRSDEAPRPDASPVEVEAETLELMETLDVLVDVADRAVPMLPAQPGEAAESTGPAGRSDGSGDRPLGEGGGEGGVPRSQRWLIAFPDGATLEEYARQLDYFGIELGKLSGDGTLSFASRLSAPVPTVRTVESGDGEGRLYFEWRGGARQAFDRQLFQTAGLTPEGTILHFYPEGTENLLAIREADSAQRDVKSIRRTFFDVVRSKDGYEFKVRRHVFF